MQRMCLFYSRYSSVTSAADTGKRMRIVCDRVVCAGTGYRCDLRYNIYQHKVMCNVMPQSHYISLIVCPAQSYYKA